MLQDNPLLAQLKQQLHTQAPRAEGIVKAHEKGYGFLETDNKKSYFIPANKMKNVMDGDKVSGIVIENGDKTAFEPETLLEPSLNTFLGQITFANKALEIIPQNMSKMTIKCKTSPSVTQQLKAGDWVKAKITSHALENKQGFSAEITQFVTEDNTPDYLWLMALAKYDLAATPLADIQWQLTEHPVLTRFDLTQQPFFTIDGASTEDMDDALSISQDAQGNYHLLIAIADPSAYIAENSDIDALAYQRAFSTYLPSFTVPMLPVSLANERCSLKADEKRPAIVCHVTIEQDGNIIYDTAEFHLAWIISKAKLTYDNVSDFIANNHALSTDVTGIAEQLVLLSQLAKVRTNWRYQHALLFKDNSEYRFVFDNNRQVTDIIKETKLSAHKMVEEAMVIANQVLTYRLTHQLGFGIFNVHSGFDPKYLDSAIKLLSENQIENFDKERLSSLAGYKDLRRLTEKNERLDYRLRRFQAPADFAIEPYPHFGLGFEAYATWTSPIRKYGDLLNHRLLKALMAHESHAKPNPDILSIMNERRKAGRLAERELNNKLYCQFLKNKVGQTFAAQIIDLNRGGAKVRLTDIGAVAFLPATLIHPVRGELILSPENGHIKIKDEVAYQLLDFIDVTINEVKVENTSVIVKIAAAE
ncbi:exoribonuclease-2 [Orbus hercynius]|uniref:Exoribonuclease II n=1 Tax=Orbus hercynius TaxID=593135 RepID=A0A495RJ33_9GAMM|nr:exoribonuclease II [Orbus hercynius]RKS87166.1 exoribonuclease-2 [Orbus hercynius]